MAQHISILNNDFHSEIKTKIIQHFAKRNIGLTSLKYEELKDNDYKLVENDRVFINKRKIKGKEEIFEIHYEPIKHEIIDIFWIK